MAKRVLLSNSVISTIDELSSEKIFKIEENDDINIKLSKILAITKKDIM